MRTRPFERHTTKWAAIGVAATVLVLGGCGDDDPEDSGATTTEAAAATTTTDETTTTTEDDSAGQDRPSTDDEGTVNLAEREADGTAEDLVGQTVTVRGEVGEAIGPRTLRIDGAEQGEGTLILVTNEDADVAVGDVVEASGEVVEYVVDDVGADFDIEIDDDAVELDDNFAVVAREVTPAE